MRTEYDSIGEFLKSNARWETSKHTGSSSHRTGEEYFHGTKTYDEALRLIKCGWRDGAKRVGQMRAELDSAVAATVAAKAVEMRYDVEGDLCDIGRLAIGEPECCMMYDEQGPDESKKVVKIIANVCVSGSVSHRVIFARGAAVLAAVDILESLGVRVELIAGFGLSSSYNGGNPCELHVMVKRASEPVETDRLAYVLCHASFLRRHGFAAMELAGFDPNCSYPAKVTSDDDAIILPELRTGRDPSRSDTIRQVLDICQKAGIRFDDSEIEALASK